MLAITAFLLRTCVNLTQPPVLPVWVESARPTEVAAKQTGTTYVDAQKTKLVLLAGDHKQGYHIEEISLNNQVKPTAETSVSRRNVSSTSESFSYAYTFHNGSGAANPIANLILVVPKALGEASTTLLVDGVTRAGEWQTLLSTALVPQCEISENGLGKFVSLNASYDRYAISPGRHRSGFTIQSQFAPGFTTLYATGPYGRVPETLDGDFDLSITRDVRNLWQHVPALAPMFLRPYHCSDVLENYRSGTPRFLLQTPPANGGDKNSLINLNSQLQSGISCQAMQSWLASNHFTSNQPVTSQIANALRLALDNSEESKSKQ